MSKIIPVYKTEVFNYRYIDELTVPQISNKDYFISAHNKTFIFKQENGSVQNVNIDFSKGGIDNLYFNNNGFTTAG